MMPLIACVCAVVLAAHPAKSVKHAKSGTLPSAETILDTFVRQTGGPDAYRAIHSEVARGTIEITGLPAPGVLTTFWRRPNDMRQTIESEVLGKIEVGVKDTVCWQRNPNQPARVLEGDERRDALANAQLFSEPEFRRRYRSFRTAGVDTVDGKSAYRVELTDLRGKVIQQIFDQTTGLLARTISPGPAPSAPPSIETRTEYRDVGGVKIPYRITTQLGSQIIRTHFDSIELNVDIPPHDLEPPDDIGASMK